MGTIIEVEDMVTASHNPSKYNGYKVYGADGCQITTEAAAEILTEIEKLDIFADVRTSGFEAGVANGSIRYIPDEVYTAFVEQVKSQSVLFGEEVNKNVAIVYSPLNGTGLKPVTRTLKEMGYTNITVVKEQEQPDGNFPTCPYPNPEIKEAMALGMEYAKKCNADLLLATDPDCDRVGIAVKNKAGEYELLTGNQTGMLLLDYICSQRVKHGKMPADPVMVKTIVTMDMGEQIATHYGLRTINVLTGFKFIGEQIGKLEQQGRQLCVRLRGELWLPDRLLRPRQGRRGRRLYDLRNVQLLCHQGYQPAGQAGRAVQDLWLLPEHSAQL